MEIDIAHLLTAQGLDANFNIIQNQAIPKKTSHVRVHKSLSPVPASAQDPKSARSNNNDKQEYYLGLKKAKDEIIGKSRGDS